MSRMPDASVKHSITASTVMVAVCQRRLGLYISALAAPLNESERRGDVVTQHERLGDQAINGSNASHRHAVGLRATYDAFRAVLVAAQQRCCLQLGDRGDGTATGKAEARQRFAHLNAGHVPDMIRHGTPAWLYEFKCFTWAVLWTSASLGNGSQKGGGAPIPRRGNASA